MLNTRKIEMFDKLIEIIDSWDDDSIKEYLGQLGASDDEIDEVLKGEYDCKR